MDKLVEIKSSLENLWSDLKDESSSSVGLEKDFTHIETLCMETLMNFESESAEFIELKNFIAVASDVKTGTLNVEVDYPNLCESIEKILAGLSEK
jgi:hypothetical protein